MSLIPFHRSDSCFPPRYFQNIFVHKNVGGVEGYKYLGEGRLFSTAGKKESAICSFHQLSIDRKESLRVFCLFHRGYNGKGRSPEAGRAAS